MPDFSFERELWDNGTERVAGVDEAGRGPLAGPVYAAAVILSPDTELPGVDDSKKLSPKKRAALAELIKERAAAWAIASASEGEIDEINILNASLLAMARAVTALEPRADYLLVDGIYVRDLPTAARAIVKGDSLSLSIAAASILAKTARDEYMVALDAEYPGYGFAGHKGYPTKAHYDAIRELGPCPAHRKTFLKKLH